MRELSVAEQRYKAVLAVIAEGKTVTEVAQEWRVSRQTLHTWLARYEAGGLEALGDGSVWVRSSRSEDRSAVAAATGGASRE